MAPEGLRYLGSWTTTTLDCCYQVMECDDPRLLEQWTARWQDLIAFEIIPVMTGAEVTKVVFAGKGPSQETVLLRLCYSAMGLTVQGHIEYMAA